MNDNDNNNNNNNNNNKSKINNISRYKCCVLAFINNLQCQGDFDMTCMLKHSVNTLAVVSERADSMVKLKILN